MILRSCYLFNWIKVMDLLNSTDKEILEKLLPLAEQGDVKAQYNLGYMYTSGVSQDYEQANYWWTRGLLGAICLREFVPHG